MPRPPLLCVLLLLSACAGGERLAYRPGRTDYPEPGPRGDPWRPYIRAASNRFQVPQRWIRAVMQQESGGQEYRYGRPVVSAAGAMGLMQLMPATYADMQAQFGLGDDPFEPHDNIFAGSAYIRLMAARYGAPGFLAAYNAGPQRLDDYLSTGRPLPNETVDYVASVAPALGTDVALAGPLSAYAGDRPAVAPEAAPVRLAAFTRPARPVARCVQDTDAAFDPDSACLPAPPQPPQPQQPQQPPPAAFSPGRAVPPSGSWAIQVGAFRSEPEAHFADTMAREAAIAQLSASRSLVQPTTRFGGAVLYRARLAGLARADAGAACITLQQHDMPCMIVAPGG